MISPARKSPTAITEEGRILFRRLSRRAGPHFATSSPAFYADLPTNTKATPVGPRLTAFRRSSHVAAAAWTSGLFFQVGDLVAQLGGFFVAFGFDGLIKFAAESFHRRDG